MYNKKITLPHIESGIKDLEIRLANQINLDIKIGDAIIFNDIYRIRVIDIRRYTNFEEMLNTENWTRIMPDWSKEEILKGLRGIYPPEKENLGVLVFELGVI